MTYPVRRANELTRLDPWAEFNEIAGRMNQLVESAFAGLPAGSGWSPAVDVEETDEAYVVEADLPGVRTEDVNVEVRGGELAISGELKERERSGILRRKTRRYGRFDYRVGLAQDVDPDKIQATLKDGVLSVRIPKAQSTEPRRIAITAG